MTDRIRALHVVNAVGPSSGPANHAVALAKYTDVEAGILAWFAAEPFDEDELVAVHSLGAPGGAIGLDRASWRRANEIVDGYDLVHAHHPHSGTYAKLAAYRQGEGIVSTEGSNHDEFTRKGRIANGLTNALADRVTCVSQSVYDSFSSWERWLLDPDGVEIVYTGVDLDKIDRVQDQDWDVRAECGVHPDTVLVGTAGRLAEMKAHDTLIQAVGLAREQSDVPLELVIAGDGDLRGYLEDVAATSSVEEKVHFLGSIPRQRVYAMMRGLDLYAMPSRWEGFSSAVIEAMAIGVPCVLSDIPSFRETFEDVAAFHELDDVDDLAEVLLSLGNDEGSRKELAEGGRDLVRSTYSMEQTAWAYAAIYSAVLGK